MRLINADALGIGKAKREVFTVPEYADGWNAAIDIIDAAPTVDIVLPTRSQFKRMAVQLGYEPVIHCRECKHYRNHPNGLCYAHTEPGDNERGYKGETVCVEPEDFCSYGERKNDFVDDNKIGERKTDEQ